MRLRLLCWMLLAVVCAVEFSIQQVDALVPCVEGCNNSVLAVRYTVTGIDSCFIYDKAQCATLKRVVRKQGDECDPDPVEPVVTITWYNCNHLNSCVALCNNELATESNQRGHAVPLDTLGCLSGTQSRLACKQGE